jgi:hypothetical protein
MLQKQKQNCIFTSACSYLKNAIPNCAQNQNLKLHSIYIWSCKVVNSFQTVHSSRNLLYSLVHSKNQEKQSHLLIHVDSNMPSALKQKSKHTKVEMCRSRYRPSQAQFKISFASLQNCRFAKRKFCNRWGRSFQKQKAKVQFCFCFS